MTTERNDLTYIVSTMSIAVFALVAFVAMLLVCLFVYSKYVDLPPTDENLIANFQAHRGAYEHLRDMLKEEKRFIEVSRAGVETKDMIKPLMPPAGNFPPARYDAYLALLKEAGGYIAYYRGAEGSEVCIKMWAKGREQLQVCSMGQPPDPQETLPENTAPRPWYLGKANYFDELPYRHIEGNWYRKYN